MDKKFVDSSVKLMLALFKGKEKPKIVSCLKDGSLRFSDLQKQLAPISKKVLSEQLKKLEECGLIKRTAFTSPNIRVEYSVTPLLEYAQPLFDERKKELTPISQRVLTKHLRDLEHYGFISRVVYEKKIPHVEYSLTDLCDTLNGIGIEMYKYHQLYLHIYGKSPLQ